MVSGIVVGGLPPTWCICVTVLSELWQVCWCLNSQVIEFYVCCRCQKVAQESCEEEAAGLQTGYASEYTFARFFICGFRTQVFFC